jgi:hypothetical protein
VGEDHDVRVFFVELVDPVTFSDERYCGVVEVHVEAGYGVDMMEGLGNKTASLILVSYAIYHGLISLLSNCSCSPYRTTTLERACFQGCIGRSSGVSDTNHTL